MTVPYDPTPESTFRDEWRLDTYTVRIDWCPGGGRLLMHSQTPVRPVQIVHTPQGPQMERLPVPPTSCLLDVMLPDHLWKDLAAAVAKRIGKAMIDRDDIRGVVLKLCEAADLEFAGD